MPRRQPGFHGGRSCCAAVIRDEEMQQHAKETGEYLMEGLRKLMDEYPIISDNARSWLVHRRRNGERQEYAGAGIA